MPLIQIGPGLYINPERINYVARTAPDRFEVSAGAKTFALTPQAVSALLALADTSEDAIIPGDELKNMPPPALTSRIAQLLSNSLVGGSVGQIAAILHESENTVIEALQALVTENVIVRVDPDNALSPTLWYHRSNAPRQPESEPTPNPILSSADIPASIPASDDSVQMPTPNPGD